MTALEMAKILGQTGRIYYKNMDFSVTIADAKDGGWGRTLYLIEPTAGIGQTWVDSETVYGICDKD